MKKTFKRAIAIILSLAICFSMATVALATEKKNDNRAIIAATTVVNTLLNSLFAAIEFVLPIPDYVSAEKYFSQESENFYSGTETFLDEPAEGARWSLGFGQESIVPENLADGSKEYYTGGYFTQKINGVYDDQSVNAVALSDGSGRGTAIFAAVDGIGVGNADVRLIRAEVNRMLAEQGIENDIIAININSTHCHTVTDTQGIGLNLIGKVFINILSVLPGIKPVRSIDSEFLEIMIDGAARAIVEAYTSTESGALYYFETAGMGRDDEKGLFLDDEYSYLRNKRYSDEGYQNYIACFLFKPDSGNNSTLLANFGGHPTTINRATKLLSADFPHYMEEKLGENGMNFVFIQGAQSPISVKAGAVKTESVIEEVNRLEQADPLSAPYREAKVFGFELARLILESVDSAVEVEPVLNVAMKEVAVELERGLYQLSAVGQLLGTTCVFDRNSSTGYSAITEVGYIELGTDIAMVTVPGELVPELVYGGVVGAEESYLGTDWEYEATADVINADGGEKTVLVMGLCNDAIGYIIPDNDFAPFIADSLWTLKIGDWEIGEKLFGKAHRHYEELLSFGGSAASTIIGTLNTLIEDKNA